MTWDLFTPLEIMFHVPVLLASVFMTVSSLSERTDCEQREIYVDIHSGTNNTLCWKGGKTSPCATINLALKGVKCNYTTIRINPGTHELEHGNETEVRGKSHISIIGQVNESEVVMITCNPFAGISFIMSNNIILDSITLYGCGGVQFSTSRNFSESDTVFSFLKFQVAVYVLSCQFVQINNVIINSSIGTGLTIYNTQGNVSILDSTFCKNGENYKDYSGGGLQIEFSFCNPENASSCPNTNKSPVYNTGANYYIQNTMFTDNIAHRGKFRIYKTSNQGRNSLSFGRGGGFSISIKGNSFQNTFVIRNVTISSNQAYYGAGFYIAFHDNTSYNHLYLTNSTICNNFNPDTQTATWDTDGGGGGGKVIFAEPGSCNNIILDTLIIERNYGNTGGGLSIETSNSISPENNTVTINNTLFTHNRAFLGSAAYFTQNFDSICNKCLSLTIIQCNFTNNSPACSNDIKTSNVFASLPCSGTVYTSSLPITFERNVIFRNNEASALELHASHIVVTQMEFHGNKGKKGGAIAFYDCSYMIINVGANLIFENNLADLHGGAIYVDKCAANNQPTTLSSRCFVQYKDSTKSPNKWEADLWFYNNTIGRSEKRSNNSIYAVNTIPCWWPTNHEASQSTEADHGLNETFCWKTWNYGTGDCDNNTDSATAYIRITQKHVEVLPGGKLTIPIDIFNGRGIKKSDDDLSICIISGDASFDYPTKISNCKQAKKDESIRIFHYPEEDNSSMFSNNFSSIVIKVETVDTQLQTDFTVSFKRCEWPFFYAQEKQCSLYSDTFCCSKDDTCTQCQPEYCLQSSLEYTRGQFGQCVSKDENAKRVNGQCPLLFYNNTCRKFNTQGSDYAKCVNQRRGRLCGDCVKQHGVALNSLYLECVNCTKSPIPGLLLFILIQLIPLTVMVAAIIVCNFKVTNGTINGYILYCQIITLAFPGWYYPAWLNYFWLKENLVYDITSMSYHELYKLYALTFPFSIWNLNFLTIIPVSPYKLPVCITDTMDSLETISFWYIVAFYPFILLLLLYGWCKMYEEGYKYVVCVTRPIHTTLAHFWQTFGIKPSLVDSTVALYTICFTPITLVSLKLLHYTEWQSIPSKEETGIVFYYNATKNYFGWPHSVFGLFAILVLLILINMPMLYFLFYPFKWFQRFLDCFKLRNELLTSISDTFTGPFKYSSQEQHIDCRHFVGLSFLFRIVVMCFFYVPYNYSYIIVYLELSLSVAAAGTIMIVRPYRNNIHNLTNFLLLLLLSLLCALSYLSNDDHAHAQTILFAAMYLPLPFVIGYCIRSIYVGSLNSRMRLKAYIMTVIPQTHRDNYEYSSSINSQSYADRIRHPEDYDEQHVRYHTSQSGTRDRLTDRSTQSSTRDRLTDRSRQSIELELTLTSTGNSSNYGSINRTEDTNT